MTGRIATPPGKRVGGSIYLHRSALGFLPSAVREVVAKAAAAAAWDAWNVVRIDGPPADRVALLEYECFDQVAFPALLESCLVEADGKAARRIYRSSANPPILHRKELLLPPDHPARGIYAALTDALDKMGLFADSRRIGTRAAWERRLADAGVEVVGHGLAPSGRTIQEEAPAAVARHKTAIARQQLSAPMQALVRTGLAVDGKTVFDYGCGRGDDLATLMAAGIQASGWDPHWRPDAEIVQADAVNLGYVLNVIERPAERVDTVRRAFTLARGCLSVGVMLVGKQDVSGMRRCGDGYLSSRGTFQKYYTQAEIREFLRAALGCEPVAVGAGVFLVFGDPIEEQRFLSGRLRRESASVRIPPRLPRPLTGKSTRTRAEAEIEANRPLLEQVWSRVLQLGRLPADHELGMDVAGEADHRLGSVRRAFALAAEEFGADGLDAARQRRTEDLTVYFALNLFSGRKPYSELPEELRLDVKAFFGSLRNAEQAGRDLLFSVGKPSVILESCREAATQGLGHIEGEKSLQLDARLLDRLPPALRAYVGCADQAYGFVDGAQMIKIHISSGKITLLYFDGYDETPLPLLRERVKVNLRLQEVDFYDYNDGRDDQLLLFKSTYMTPDLPDYKRQKKFDDSLSALGVFEFARIGLSTAEFHGKMAAIGKKVKGWEIRRM